jgi:hypothetical protein
MLGLIPKEMEDKWVIYYDRPYLFFHRSWTGQPVYRIELGIASGNVEVIEALWSKDLADAGNADMKYQAQVLDFLVSNLLLGEHKPFPRPAGLKELLPGLYQHHVAGTGYAEVSTPPSKSWWKWW